MTKTICPLFLNDEVLFKIFYYNLNLHRISCKNSVNNFILSCPDGTNTTHRNVISFWNQGNIEITEQYCKTLIICVTLFSQGHYPAYIHETLFSQFATFILFKFLNQKWLARTLFSRLDALANLRECQVLVNKKCFTVKWRSHIPDSLKNSRFWCQVTWMQNTKLVLLITDQIFLTHQRNWQKLLNHKI